MHDSKVENMMAYLLKACPFCGEEGPIGPILVEGVQGWRVYCAKCDAGTGRFTTMDGAAARWNMRKDPASISDLVKTAVARFDALPPAEQIAMRLAQRRSWVVGETLLAHPEMTREAAEALYDRYCA